MPRLKVGRLHIDFLSKESLKKRFLEIILNRKPSQIVTLNSLMYNSAVSNQELASAIDSAELITPDSIGISIAASLLNFAFVKRQPGIDLIFDICQIAENKGFSIFLLGSRDQVVQQASAKLTVKYPRLKISGIQHGYFPKDETDVIIDKIKNNKPDILFVGMDVPRQEIWIKQNLEKLNIPLVMGVGGSFDVISGQLKRAPEWMQFCGMEWFFRFIQEPWRITRIIHLPFFVINIIKMK